MSSENINRNEIRKTILELIKTDEEFRLAIAGALGLHTILEELRKLRQDFNNLSLEVKKLREDFNEILKRVLKIEETLEQHSKILEQHSKLLQKLTFSIEDEAVEVIEWKLRQKLGIDVKLSRLVVTENEKEVFELNIYGVHNDLCIIGEVTIDLRIGKIREFIQKFTELKMKYPQYLRNRILKIIYCMRYTQQAIEEANKYNIWVLTWREELTKLNLETFS